METRIEHDLIGYAQVPAGAYWGIHTLRAQDNFRLSGNKVHPALIVAYAYVKKACCLANKELDFLTGDMATAMETACDEIIAGGLADQFPVDALQGGAGTSVNMNVNEVIANRALELLGKARGAYDIVHPIEHVNLHQSTNDTYPTALKIAAIYGLRTLSKSIASLQGVFQQKEKEFGNIVTIGRTELQDAVPMTLGAQFAAHAEAFGRDRWRTFKCEERLRVVNIGGTAIGTGITAPREYIFLVIEKLRELTGIGLTRAEQIIDATANADVFVEVSGILKAHAASVRKISGDLRLLHYFGEITLPACQAGSSIMPGKVNPVIMEAAISAAIKAEANDAVISQAAAHGTLQINEFLPLVALALLESLDLLDRTAVMLAHHCEHIIAHEEACRRHADNSLMLITAFVSHIGYARAQEIIAHFQKTERTSFREFLDEQLGKELTDRVLSPANLMSLGYRQ